MDDEEKKSTQKLAKDISTTSKVVVQKYKWRIIKKFIRKKKLFLVKK